jgi:hypothetical protein
MPAKSIAQRRLFALALLYKRGELSTSEVSDEIVDLAKLPEKTLRDYAKTKEENLPQHANEDFLQLNPNSNVNGMGPASLPGNPGSADSFATQIPGSGDFVLPKKKKKILSLSKFIKMKK